ncbi:MAG: hypothetical protein D6796_17035 [Caldilineae bacterium]|nr:MAG: hypothetical protein D6796_17035 [Caldilineae bacterium]
MVTKEKIRAEIEKVDEAYLDELYRLIQSFVQRKQSSKSSGVLSKLQEVRIDGPVDFAKNHDFYVTGE